MSEIKARYVGPLDEVALKVPVGDEGVLVGVIVPHGGELPMELDGLPVSAEFRDSLLEQKDNWTKVSRKAKADEKED
jgi:hypothetical protein